MSGQAERAIDLGNQVNGRPEAVAAVLPELAEILRAPDDPHSLCLAIEALGHAWDPRAATLLLGLVDHDDEDREVRAEALAALADLADPRAVSACLDAFARESDSIDLLTLRAAGTLAEPSLLPALQALEQEWADHEPDQHTAALHEALRRCSAGAEQIAAPTPWQ